MWWWWRWGETMEFYGLKTYIKCLAFYLFLSLHSAPEELTWVGSLPFAKNHLVERVACKGTWFLNTAGLTLFQTVPMPSKKCRRFRFGHPHSHVHLQLEIETFIGSSLFGEPLQLTSGIQRKNLSYLLTKQRPLWLHVSIFTHFNQPSTLRQSHVPDTKDPHAHTRDTTTAKCTLW